LGFPIGHSKILHHSLNFCAFLQKEVWASSQRWCLPLPAG
jgi:hypothetical protein